MKLKHAVLAIAVAGAIFAAGSASASDYAVGIQQQIDHQQIVVKVDHLQAVDKNITARDEALLQHYRDELKTDQSRSD